MSYAATRDRVEHYFDRTATRTWERLTSDAPVSGIRATVREGRDRMRALLLDQLPADLTGRRVLDAGCGTGALAAALARRGAEVTAVDISPRLVAIARDRIEDPRIDFRAGDMLDPALGRFDHVVAMDSMIYYTAPALAGMLGGLRARTRERIVFTLAPRTPALMVMWRAGRLFPSADRSPVMVPHTSRRLERSLRRADVPGRLSEAGRVQSGFYISAALVHEETPG